MFITGPDVIRAVTRETLTKEALGGAAAHNITSGVARFMEKDDSAFAYWHWIWVFALYLLKGGEFTKAVEVRPNGIYFNPQPWWPLGLSKLQAFFSFQRKNHVQLRDAFRDNALSNRRMRSLSTH